MELCQCDLSLFPDQNEAAAAALLLWRCGCCSRCILRFLGESQTFIYRNSNQEIEEFVKTLRDKSAIDSSEDSESPATDTPVQLCVSCLGVLQDKYCSLQFTEQIVSHVKEANFQFSSYLCSLMLPVSLIVRQHAVWLHLKDHFSETLKNKSEDDLSPIKEIWKWYMGPMLNQRLGAQFEQKSLFEVYITLNHPNTENECKFLLSTFPDTFRRRKYNQKIGWELFTRASVAHALERLPEKSFKMHVQCPPARVTMETEIESITCNHSQIFLAGRYNKYSRYLSQTPWICDGKRKTESSLQEQVCDLMVDMFKPDDYNFSSSGREDVDVRMLGTGRPFIVELINPHIVNFGADDLKDLQKKINESTKEVAVHDLQFVSREDTSKLKEGEIEKTKTYAAICWSEKEITSDDLDKLRECKELVLSQKTPIRVLHRRPLAVRERVIYSMSAEIIDTHHFMLHMNTQAGTYIKEFVHSDFGRTKPSAGEILNSSCDILQLDVSSVNVEWPPRLET